MQQNVVPPVGVTLPVGVPSMAVQLPPFGGTVTDALAEVTLGFPEKATHCPELAERSFVWQLGGDAPSE